MFLKMEPIGSIFCRTISLSTSHGRRLERDRSRGSQTGLETSDGPVPGAKLRELVARIAPKHGVNYPPPGHESEKFGDFLKQFNSSLILLRREGQDLLVAPSDMPQLLQRSGNTYAQIRDDIFEAFTRIPRGSLPRQPWYVRDADTIEWLAENEKPDASRFARIPPATRVFVNLIWPTSML
jgi:hypothetical protein